MKITVPEMSVFALAGALATIGFAVALIVGIWTWYGGIYALTAGLVLSVAGTAWARNVEAETRLTTRPQPARLIAPDDDGF